MLSTDVDIEYEGITYPATLDLSLPLPQLLRSLVQLSLSLPVDPSSMCLRLASTQELLTDDNIRRKVTHGDRLLLVQSPGAEALALVKILRSSDRERDLKKYIFTLQKALCEPEFARAFVDLSGVHILVEVIRSTTGNSLAYALNSLLHLCDHCYGLEKLPGDFLEHLIHLILTHPLTTISRPATLILAKLISTPPPVSPMPIESPCLTYGPIAPLLRSTRLLPILSDRLSSPDFLLGQAALTLLSTLLAASAEHDDAEWLATQFDRVGVRVEVAKLMRLECGAEMGKLIRDFQRLVLQDQRRAKRSMIPEGDPRFEKLWSMSELGAAKAAPQYGTKKWRLLGFDTEAPHRDLLRVGSLGLDLLLTSVSADPAYFRDHVSAQMARPIEKRCPWARTAAEAVEILSDHLHISTGYATSTSFQPLQLLLPETHHITLLALHRAWGEMEASSSDLGTVSAIIRSQLRYALREDVAGSMGVWEFRRAMLEEDFAQVRARQLRDLAVEDDLLSKLPVRSLRDRIYRESYEFMKQQRIDCLLRGAWFPTPPPMPGSGVPGRNVRQRPWRYYRLSPDKRTLHWAEFSERSPDDAPPGMDKLPDKVDLMLVTHIIVGASPAQQRQAKRASAEASHHVATATATSSQHIPAPVSSIPGMSSPTLAPMHHTITSTGSFSSGSGMGMASPPPPSSMGAGLASTTSFFNTTPAPTLPGGIPLPTLGFALMCGPERALASFMAPSVTVYSEWTDGFHMLFDRSIASRETADLIQGLTETMTRVYLLGVGAERVEVPAFREPPIEPPEDYDFYYSELV